jgi:hypothetical protein
MRRDVKILINAKPKTFKKVSFEEAIKMYAEWCHVRLMNFGVIPQNFLDWADEVDKSKE